LALRRHRLHELSPVTHDSDDRAWAAPVFRNDARGISG
jgi:hypothetical protein